MRLIKLGRLLAIASAITIGSFASHAVASTIATWTYETSQPTTAGPVAAEVGTGNSSGGHSVIATYSSPAGNGSAHSFSANSWSVGDYWQFAVSTTGLSGVSLTFDQTGSNTGPANFQVQTSTNGTTFTALPSGSYVVGGNLNPPGFWNATTPFAAYTHTYSLSPALDNKTTAYVRLVNTDAVAINGGVVAGGGTDRVDNVSISGVAVPEPASAVLMVMGGMALVGVGRRFAC